MGDLAFFTLLNLPLEGWNFLGKRVFLIRELFILIVHNNWLTEAFRLAECLKELFFSLIFLSDVIRSGLKKEALLAKFSQLSPHTNWCFARWYTSLSRWTMSKLRLGRTTSGTLTAISTRKVENDFVPLVSRENSAESLLPISLVWLI